MLKKKAKLNSKSTKKSHHGNNIKNTDNTTRKSKNKIKSNDTINYHSKKNVKNQSRATEDEDRIMPFGNNTSRPWYNEFPQVADDSPLDNLKCNDLRKEAGKIFEREIAENFGKPPKTIPKSDYSWMKTVIQKGTVSDKIAALVLLIQDDPVVNLNNLKTLGALVKIGKKRECFMAIDSLVELFQDSLLPPNRKLKLFVQQPLSMIDELSGRDPEKRNHLLAVWFFEEQLKQQYTSFLSALNDAAHDTVDANKERAIVAMNKLLTGHPEQEATLLSNIVNKLGDPSHKIGSKVIYTLTQLLDTHPAMKAVVMEEVEKVIFRPNMSKRAQYYSVCFLSQFSFSASEGKLASSLTSIYFSLFKACIKTGEIDSRMMGALLTGVSRAYPYAKAEATAMTEHINTMYKVAHLSSATIAIHALSLLHLVAGDEDLSNRFMALLYKKISELTLFKSTHHPMLLSLLFKVLRRDSDNARVLAFIKRLLQVCVHISVPVACGLLMLISEIIHKRKNFSLRMEDDKLMKLKLEKKEFVDDDDDGVEHYKDVPIEGAEEQVEKTLSDEDDKSKVSKVSSWFHAALKPAASSVAAQKNYAYDPYQRNPLYANGDLALPAELIELSRHFHPTVSLFASNILLGNKVNYTGDPLQDFTLIRFLDKFVFKNPKKIDPRLQVTTFSRFGRKKFYSSAGLKKLRANTADYLNNDVKAIPVDETYLFNYLKEKEIAKSSMKKGDSDRSDESDVESVGDEEFDEMLSKVAGSAGDHLDFMSEIGSLPTESKKGRSDEESEDGSEDGLDEDEDLGSDVDEEGDDDDMSDDMIDDDDLDSNAEDFDGDELDDLSDEGDELDSDLDNASPPKRGDKRKDFGLSSKKKSSESPFASAEEFSELLENESNFNSGKTSDFVNRDKAAVKQLKWELNRNRWMKGKSNFKRSESFKNKRNSKKRKGGQPQSSEFKRKKQKLH